ncbi:MAG: hypothetical protein ACR2RF_03135 [Geminicoccaceae bacterium]
MVARAVTRAWQASLAAPSPIDRSGSSAAQEKGRSSLGEWQRPVAGEDVQISAVPNVAANDDTDEDPNIQVDKRDDIVPRRPGVAGGSTPDDSLWSSHYFWKGIVVGAAIVLLVKTVIAVQAPLGVDWFGH